MLQSTSAARVRSRLRERAAQRGRAELREVPRGAAAARRPKKNKGGLSVGQEQERRWRDERQERQQALGDEEAQEHGRGDELQHEDDEK